ncbi:MAG: hypothetical protein JXR58_09580, partial [Bacteroidales bacterium]|nr:hypothetical protein [Bacteroidales bacterium]
MKKLYLTAFFLSILFALQSQTKTVGCSPPTSSVYLEINNVRTLIHSGGDMWWDLSGNPKYEVPKGSGKQA